MRPHIAGHLASLLEREAWDTQNDWQNGAAAIAEFLGMMICITEITDRLDRINASLGYDAGKNPTDPLYNAADTQKSALSGFRSMLENKLGYALGGDIESSLSAIESKIDGASDEEVAAILQLILAML
jgi:hypothetical protein